MLLFGVVDPFLFPFFFLFGSVGYSWPQALFGSWATLIRARPTGKNGTGGRIFLTIFALFCVLGLRVFMAYTGMDHSIALHPAGSISGPKTSSSDSFWRAYTLVGRTRARDRRVSECMLNQSRGRCAAQYGSPKPRNSSKVPALTLSRWEVEDRWRRNSPK